jgi:hypothetical protein
MGNSTRVAQLTFVFFLVKPSAALSASFLIPTKLRVAFFIFPFNLPCPICRDTVFAAVRSQDAAFPQFRLMFYVGSRLRKPLFFVGNVGIRFFTAASL